jgi:preprotein translocase subunit SecY
MLLELCLIFAQAIMFIPAALAGLSKSDTSQSIVGAFSMFGFWYNFVFATLIIVFTFFIPQLRFLLIKCLMI